MFIEKSWAVHYIQVWRVLHPGVLYQSCKVLHPGLQNLTSRGCKSLHLVVTNPYIHLVAPAPPKPGKSALGMRLDDDGDDDDEDDGDEENDAGDNDDDDDDDKDDDELS